MKHPLLLAVSLLAFTQTLKAQSSVADYWGFAVTESAELYGFTSETERVLIAGGAVLTPRPSSHLSLNHLATDVANNRLIYTLGNFAVPSAVLGIFAWDFNTNSRVDLTNGANVSGLIGSSDGGGGFYNGNYYLWDDGGSGQGLLKITFNGSGLVDTISKPWGDNSTLGELGDIAIDASGMMYVFTNSENLYRMDLNDPLATPILLGNYSAYSDNGQLFIDDQGRLLTRANGSGNWISLNPAGGVLETITGPTEWKVYTDLSEGSVVGVVPEPSGALLLGFAGSFAILRRRRI